MFSDGYLYLRGDFGVMNIIRNAITPIRPMNMSVIIIIFPAVFSIGVVSNDIPAVLNAAHDSNSSRDASISGITVFNAIVLSNIANIVNDMIVYALRNE